MSDALVHVTSPRAALPQFTTSFGEFYAKIVHALDCSSVTTTQGAVVWTSHVVHAMLRDGAWPLILAASDIVGRKPVVMDDVMDVLGRLDRVLTVGMLLRYGNVDAAVRAFIDLLGVIDRALVLGLKPGMTLSADAWRALRMGNDIAARIEIAKQTGKPVAHAAGLWQTPVYQFLAECVKAARVHADKIEAAQKEFASVNRLRSPSGRSYSVDIDRPGRIDARYGRLDAADSAADATGFMSALEIIASATEEAELIGRYPINFTQLEPLVPLGSELPTRWFDTQILLAAIEVADRQYLKFDEIESAFSAVKQLPRVDLIARTVSKLVAEGMQLDDPVRQRLFGRLSTAVAQLKKQQHVVDYLAGSQFLMSGDVFALGMSHEEALRKATNLGDMRDMPPKVRRDFAVQLGNAIVWSRVTTADVSKMLKVGAIRLNDIVAHAHETKNPSEVAKRLVAHGTISESQIISLIHRGLIEGSREFVFNHWSSLSNEYVLAFALRSAKSYAIRERGSKDEDAHFIVKAMARLTQHEVESMLADLGNRFAFVMTLGAYIVFPDEFAGVLTSAERRRFRETVPEEMLRSFAMAKFVWSRSDAYRLWRNPMRVIHEVSPPWERLNDPVFVNTNDVFLLQIASQTLEVSAAELLAEKSEEAWMRWMYEGYPKFDKILARFLADRDRYLKKIASLGLL